MSLLRLIAPLEVPRTAAIETLLLPLALVAAGIWLAPLDPLGVRSEFPWVWLAPALLALRYGPFAGLGAAAVLVAAWFGLQALGLAGGEFPELFFLGGLIAVMLCGEFASVWRGRVRRAEAMQLYLDQRLEHLTHQHYLLRLSHDRLEQDLISRPMAMRDALTALRGLTSGPGTAEGLPGADMLLRLLAQFCQIEAGGLFPVRDARVLPEPLARIGMPFDLDAADPLLRFALEQKGLAHVQSEGAEGRTRYLVAAPLAAAQGPPHGMLVVQRMPFFALTVETLQTLNLMLGYYAGGLDARATAAPVLATVPHCPLEFAFELMRLWRIRQESGVRSAVVALSFSPRPGFEALPEAIRRQQRSLDVTWMLDAGRHRVLATLMPLASLSGAEGYFSRIEGWLRRQYDCDLGDAGVAQHVLLVDAVAPVALLHNLFRITGVPEGQEE
jgi:hypothetical protein